MRNSKLLVSTMAVLFLSLFIMTGFSTASEAKPEMILRMAGQQPADHQASLNMKKVAKWVKEGTNGRIEIKTYPTSQLGDWVLIYEEMIRGTIDMALTSVPSQFDPRLELPYVNYYIRNYDDVAEVYKKDGWLYNKMDEFNSRLGVKFLGFNVEGMGGFGMTKKITEPLNPKTNKNALLRVCSIDAFKVAADDGGYSTVTIPYAELYTALQTGVADGWSGGSPVHSYLFFKDVIKYYYQLNNFVESESYMMSKKTWDKLRAAGIEVFTYSDEELAPLFKHCQDVTWKNMERKMGKKLMQEFKAQYGDK